MLAARSPAGGAPAALGKQQQQQQQQWRSAAPRTQPQQTARRRQSSSSSSRAGRASSVRAAAAPAGTPYANGRLRFSKYQGLGNDFILVDNRHSPEPVITPEQAARLCDRHFGVGGDGVIFALPPVGDTDFTMRIYNSDGSEPEMCGNGIRCLARFVADEDGTAAGGKYRIHTLAGLIQPELLADGQVRVDMGEPILEASRVPTTLPGTQDVAGAKGVAVRAPLTVSGREWSVTCVSMGNPHALVYSRDGGQALKVDDISAELEALGPLFERNAAFPARTNTEFVEVLTPSHVRMVVWERGAGRTLACGTGACATVVAGVLEGRVERTCRVDLPGGPLVIEWREADNRIYMTGPAELVFAGAAGA